MEQKQRKIIKVISLFTLIYIGCTGICFLLDFFKIDNLNFIMIYILGVLFIAIFTDGYIVSLLFSLLCVASYNFFFTYPRMSLAVFDLKYIVTFVIMFAISIIVSRMTFNLKKKLIEINELNKEKFKIEQETEREKLKATMLRSISHDLRTPLTSISSGAELLLHDQNLSETDKKEILQNVIDESNWTVRLVEDLLLLTKVEANNLIVHKDDEAIEEIIPEAIRNIASIKGNRKITIDIPKDLMLVSMDATLIIQLLSNILNNAVKFTADDGKIKIQVFNSGSEAVFRVYNDGKKLSDDKIDKMFDLYYTDADRSSTGIGLAVCKAIVAAHGGKISARNLSDGVVFEFTLPMEGR
ncbi:MAG: DUF4118 domain-containing protein [Clostridia bacterium]